MQIEESVRDQGITAATMHAVSRGLWIGLAAWTVGPAAGLAAGTALGGETGTMASVAWWWFCSVPSEAPLLALTRATTLVAGVFLLGAGGKGKEPSARKWGLVAGAMMSAPAPGLGAWAVRGIGHLATEALSFV